MDEGYYMNRTIHDLWREYSFFVARVATFAPERREGANDATRDTNKLFALQKLCDYHYYQYRTPNSTNLFQNERLFNTKPCCGLQHFAVWPATEKERFREGSLSFGRVIMMVIRATKKITSSRRSIINLSSAFKIMSVK